MNVNDLIREDLVIFSNAKTKTEAISELADVLYGNNKVKESYKKAVLEREETFQLVWRLNVLESQFLIRIAFMSKSQQFPSLF